MEGPLSKMHALARDAGEAKQSVESALRAFESGDVELARQILNEGGPQLLELARSMGFEDAVLELMQSLEDADPNEPLTAPQQLTLTR